MTIRLITSDLHKNFLHRQVISNINLELASGDKLFVFGSNGSGKSTLLKMLAGLLQPSSGTVSLYINNTKEAVRLPDRKHCGYAAPALNYYGDLTCSENLKYIIKTCRLRTDNINDILKKWELDSVKNLPVSKLSTGQQERLKLAGAMLGQPELLLLDEPFANLDTSGSDILRRELESSFNKSIVIIATNRKEDIIGQKTVLNLVK